jgi:hypothetical protein
VYFQEAYFVYLSCTLEDAQAIAPYPDLSGGVTGRQCPRFVSCHLRNKVHKPHQ